MPSASYEAIWVEYLHMVQSIISRLSNQSAALKNFAISITAALFGGAVSLNKPSVLFVGLLVVLVFWFLDTQYLRSERAYRALYDEIRSRNWASKPDFALTCTRPAEFWPLAFSWSIAPFYLLLVFFLLSAFFVMGMK